MTKNEALSAKHEGATTVALKLALEALTHLQPNALTSFYTIGNRDKAITAIREALAQPEQEPVAKKHELTIDLDKYAGTYGGYIKEQK